MRRAVPLLLALAGTGCFSMTQEIWIEPEGTARISVDVGFTEHVLSLAKGSGEDPMVKLRADLEKTRADLAGDPGVSGVEVAERSEGGMRFLKMDVRVRTVAALNTVKGLAGPHGDTARRSDVRVQELPSGNLLFAGRHEVPQNTELDELLRQQEDTGDAAVRAMMGGFFAEKYFTVRLHAPRIVSANGVVDAERRTVEWKTPMIDVIAPGAVLPEMRAEIDPGRRRWLWIAGGAAAGVLLLGGIAAVVVRARRG
jgi:hypothetical protein